jgi:hypothetical protein
VIRRSPAPRASGILAVALVPACLIATSGLAACAVSEPLVRHDVVGPAHPLRGPRQEEPQEGELVVFSGTRSSVVEQSEYPIHTDYTLMDDSGRELRRVPNSTGLFGGNPVVVPLPTGSYKVRAQNADGRWVIVPVVIESGQRTVVDLDHQM